MSKQQFPHFCKHPDDLDMNPDGISLFNTPESMETPCSVKATGKYLTPPLPFFEVAICDLKESNSS